MATSVPADIAEQNRAIGSVIDPIATMEIYGELLARQPTDGVVVIRDLRYGEAERHVLDVYKPAGPASGPVVIFFHGGGYSRGDKSDRSNIGFYFARHGVIALIANYRLAPDHKWPSGADDVVSALRWAQREVTEHGGDAGRIFLMGESAGATHVALAGLVSRFHGGVPFGAAGLILHSGSYNVALERCAARAFGIPSPDLRNEAYFGADPSRYPAMSTIDLIDAPNVPTFIIYAEYDPIQFQIQAGELFAALARGARCPELLQRTGHGHISQICSFNTDDTSVSGPVLRFTASNLVS